MEYAKIQRMALMDRAAALIQYSESGHSDYSDTVKAFVKAGWHKLGAGNYGSAWSHNELPGYVVKVCGRVDGDSYPAWAYYCAANPGEGLPEYEFPTFASDNGVFMVMMPEYKDATDLGYDNSKFSAEVLERWQTAGYILGCGYVPGDQCVWNNNTREYDRWMPAPSEFLDNMLKAREFFDKYASWDLHTGNVMIDPRNGKLVVTDPIHQGDNGRMITEITGRPFRRENNAVQLKLGLEDTPIAAPAVKLDAMRWSAQQPNIQQLPKRLRDIDFGAIEARVERDMRRVLPKPRTRRIDIARWAKEQAIDPEQLQDLAARVESRLDNLLKVGGIWFALLPRREARWNLNAADPVDNLRNIHVDPDLAKNLVRAWHQHQEIQRFQVPKLMGHHV